MSRAPSEEVRELLDWMIDSHAGWSNVDLAVKLGRSESYVRQLRDGWRPGRIDKAMLARLRDLRAAAEVATLQGQDPKPAAPAASPIPPGMDPVTWAAAKLDLISQIAGDASAQLVRYRRGRRFTPEEKLAIGGEIAEERLGGGAAGKKAAGE